MQLDQVKRDRIISAAVKVFGQSSFKKAATDDIVKEAGISKGLLFYYFGNKMNLYIYVYNYVMDIFRDEVYKAIDTDEKDFLKRISVLIRAKLCITHKYNNSSYFKLILNSRFDDLDDWKETLEKRQKENKAMGYEKLFSKLDYSLFRDDMDPKLITNSIIWTLEGYSNLAADKIAQKGLDLNEVNLIFKDIDRYIGLLRKAFYKEEIEE
jgi:AcrR family transcriptional regulator